jgi:4-hydroxy-tetrahydrodipicolinate synthase
MVKGIITPVVTLLDDKKNIDYVANEKLIRRLIDAGIDGIVLLGSTGEFPNLTIEEKESFIEQSLNYIDNDVFTIVGISSTVLDETEQLIKVAEKCMAKALMVIAPYYFTMDEEGLYSYFSHIAKITDLPIILYNFPDRNNINLSTDLVYKLAQDYKNIVGIKDTVDNISHTRKLIQQFKNFNGEFHIYSGLDEYLIPNLGCGGSGAICGLSNIAPKLYVKIWQAFKKRDLDELLRLEEKLMILLELFEITNPFTISIKYALRFIDSDFLPVIKYPEVKVSDEKLDKIKHIIDQLSDFINSD